ncbi:FtsK/SpoIIIE domain-containing protein [Streptomyces sp. NBC_01571]|uniref:FtsK/SpoIIIE domain-containing protein n=1 Tax=Streptomyces sp. NBC_01571 TaxID=2975883 RepID=UPI0022511975|nr:FtsK/SpoIIIE domain-containing protein [Streptomyces sp. NBC_01571]MCX4576541.1 FtsK/SpoIIIE domain-containing protein [Streptomyces sp. NBC_01571]
MTNNVVQLHKDAPQDAQDAHAFTEDARDTLTETIIDVAQDAKPRPVDPPAEQLPTGTWIAERQAYLADAPPVVPTFLRNAAEFVNAARWTASYYGHVTAFHAIRLPVYALRLLTRAPRGLARMVLRWGRWVADTEARPVEARAAASADIEAWLSLSREHSRRVRPRRIVSLVVATTTGVTTLAGCFLAPGWTLAATLAAATLVGLNGKKSDGKPLVTRYVATNVLRRLDSTEVIDALAAIGIEGKKGKRGVEFAAEVMRDGPGWRAEVDLPPGVEATAVLEKRAALAAAMRRPISTVWPSVDRTAHPGRLVLWVAQRDPAKSGRKLWPLMKQGTADVYEPLPYGFDPRGNLIDITLMYSNLLVGGIPGSGKTSCALAVVLGVALDPTAELWIYELKGSGDLEAVKPICHRYVSGDDDPELEAALGGMRSGIAEYQRRAKFIKGLPASEVPDGRRVTRALAEKYPEQQLGPRVIVIDEVQELFTHPDYKDEATALATRLIKKGRAYGLILILLTQNPDANSLPTSVSSSVGTRLCLAVMDWRANNNVLGTGAYDRGLRATDISVDEQGTGILARGREGFTVRAAFIKQTEAEEVGKRALALRTAAGTLTGQAVGAQVEEQDVETIVDHLRAIWPDGVEAIHSHRLVEALAPYRPDLYKAWLEMEPAESSTALSAALKPLKVATKQLTIRECCGGAKGLRYADLPAAEDGE